MSAVAEARLRALKVSKWCARLLVGGAFALSAVSLTALAQAAHIPTWLAWIWPVVIDGSIYQASTAVMALAGRTEQEAKDARKWFQWVIGGGVAVSVAANGLHAWTTIGHPLTWWQVTAVAVVPPILLLVATHGVTLLGGLDNVVAVDQAESVEQAGPEPAPQRVTIERVEPVAEVEQERAIEVEVTPQLPARVEPQVSLEAATAGHPPRRPAAPQRDPERVLQAKELAAAGEPVAVIAERLEVSTRTVRRYLQVEIEETTVHPPQDRPQLFAVADRSEGLEVVNG
ncbi:DUF2637 domain-containing protein [Streptomyces gardneri]|nr:DUF2637 domain-containing protein [Streptomyces gardneri]